MAPAEGERAMTDRVHIGTMGWSYDFWVGTFYPQGLKSNEFLAEYSKHFDTVEVNNTFYRVPDKSVVAKWKEQTSSKFLFSVKFPRTITHKKMLKDCESELKFFIERVDTLQNKLGPLLLQFPPTFGIEKLAILKDFLQSLPKGYRYAVEVRNPELLTDKFRSLLKENKTALVVNPFNLETEQITGDFVYIRWEKDMSKVDGTLGKVEVNRTNEIRLWAERIIKLLDKTKEVFGYFSKYYSGHPPTDARQLIDSLNLTV